MYWLNIVFPFINLVDEIIYYFIAFKKRSLSAISRAWTQQDFF